MYKLIFVKKGYICSYCSQQILIIDDSEEKHIIPCSKGGRAVIENEQLLHRYCI